VIFFAPKRVSASRLIGLELQADGIAVALKSTRDDVPHLDRLAFLAASTDAERFAQLQQFVAEHKLRKMPCNLVLPSSGYQLYLLEAPEVPDSDMREAVRWRLKDLVSQPLEKIALDLFFLPTDVARGNRKMVYVAVAIKDYLASLVESVAAAGLVLRAIDISELSLRNVAIHLVDPQFDSRGVAVARIKQGGGSLSIFRGGNMYLSRQFDLQYGGGLLDDLPTETLALELQRSLDYYERQLGQATPSVVYVGGENIQEDKLTPSLRNILTVPLQFLDFSGAVGMAESFDPGLMQMCLVATGAALRREFTG
jgi:MSHA biogenesis protein MshI